MVQDLTYLIHVPEVWRAVSELAQLPRGELYRVRPRGRFVACAVDAAVHEQYDWDGHESNPDEHEHDAICVP